MAGLCSKLIFTYVRLCSTLLLHIIFIFLLILRVGLSENDWSWAAIFSPIFLLDAICVVYLIIYTGGYIRDKLEHESRRHNTYCFPHQNAGIMPLIFYIIGLITKILAEVGLVAHLETEGAVPFYVSAVFMSMFFVVLSVGLFLFAFKPTAQLIRTLHYPSD